MIEPRTRSLSSDDNMIPLINIVFLLLIFFMVAGHIQKRPDAEISLPTLKVNSEEAHIQNLLELYVDGRMTLNQSVVSQDDLSARLDTISGELTLVVDRRLTAGDLEQVLKPLRTQAQLSVSLLLEGAP